MRWRTQGPGRGNAGSCPHSSPPCWRGFCLGARASLRSRTSQTRCRWPQDATWDSKAVLPIPPCVTHSWLLRRTRCVAGCTFRSKPRVRGSRLNPSVFPLESSRWMAKGRRSPRGTTSTPSARRTRMGRGHTACCAPSPAVWLLPGPRCASMLSHCRRAPTRWASTKRLSKSSWPPLARVSLRW
jgi:hypothetical protein